MSRYRTTIFLLGLTLLMGLTRTGFLQVSGTVGRAFTILHLPAILAGIADGPIAGGVVGLTFGLTAWAFYPPPDPIMHLLPRVLIGVVSGLAFRAVRAALSGSSARNSLAALAAAVSGSLANTLGVAGISLLRGYYTPEELLPVAVFHGSVEMLLAVTVTVPLTVLIFSDKRWR